jgi:hypothetical protein
MVELGKTKSRVRHRVRGYGEIIVDSRQTADATIFWFFFERGRGLVKKGINTRRLAVEWTVVIPE